jgi:hypothetical protein
MTSDISGQITATDADSGRFGQVEYALRGFGAEKFRVSAETGEIMVSGCGDSEAATASGESSDACLDFESQKSYILTYTGTDGGGQARIKFIFYKNGPPFDFAETSNFCILL